jgi:hypothetical protein
VSWISHGGLSTSTVLPCSIIPRLQYIVKKGVGVKKESRVDTELCKFLTTLYGKDPYITPETFISSSGNIDCIFQTVIYTLNDGEMKDLSLCRVNLKGLPNFRQQAEVTSPPGFCTGVI